MTTRPYVIDQLISAKAIAARVEALAREISAHFRGTDKLVVVGLLRGSFVFIADLVRAGFATLPSKPPRFWETPAARLVDAQAPGLARRLEGAPEILAASAKALSDLWVTSLRRDPFSLLDDKTRRWVEPAIEELGRRFVISDFESPEPVWRPA